MSTSYLTLLLRADDETGAISEATSLINTWFDWGWLSEGDKLHVIEHNPVIVDSSHPTELVATLRDLQDQRRHMIAYRISSIRRCMQRCFIEGLEEISLKEETPSGDANDMGMIGHHLTKLGRLISRDFDPECVLYTVPNYEAGVDPGMLVNLESDPSGWALVDVIVG